MSDGYRLRILVALAVVSISGMLFFLSFHQENSEAFLFPAIASFSMLCLGLLSLTREALKLCEDDYKPFPLLNQLPAIIIMIIGVYAIDHIGMYESTFLVLLLVSFWYSSMEHISHRLLHSLLFATGFSVLMYLLFSFVLNVQFSKGLLI